MERQRVAVLRALPGLGDVLCATPALRSLRRGHPGAHITLVATSASRWAGERFAHLVDAVAELPGWPSLPEGRFDARRAVRFLCWAQERRFDLVVQLHGDGSATNALCALLGGAHLVASTRPGRVEPPGTYVPWVDGASEVSTLLAVARAAGGAPTGTELEWPVLPGDLDGLPDLPDGPFAVLHPGASTARRRWPADHFAALGRSLRDRGLDVVVTGGPAEQPLTTEVADGCGGLDLGGRTTLGGLGVVFHRAALAVTNDTGPAHLAVATDTPSVVVFSGEGTDPARWGPLDRDLHPWVVPPAGSAPGLAQVEASTHRLLGARSGSAPAPPNG